MLCARTEQDFVFDKTHTHTRNMSSSEGSSAASATSVSEVFTGAEDSSDYHSPVGAAPAAVAGHPQPQQNSGSGGTSTGTTVSASKVAAAFQARNEEGSSSSSTPSSGFGTPASSSSSSGGANIKLPADRQPHRRSVNQGDVDEALSCGLCDVPFKLAANTSVSDVNDKDPNNQKQQQQQDEEAHHHHLLLETICGHTFHFTCVCKWFSNSPYCPSCHWDQHNIPCRDFTEEEVDKMTTTKKRPFDQQISRGGFGVVYKGHWNGKNVAVKTFRSDDAGKRELLTELRHLLSLRHPRLIAAVGKCCVADLKCIIFPLLTPLVDENKKFFALTVAEKVQVCCDITSAVVYMHSKRKLHHDIKPQNVLLDDQKRGILIDLGIAKTMETTAGMAGTLHYIAPEQKAHRTAGEMFALGLTLVYILVGSFPPPAAAAAITGGQSDDVSNAAKEKFFAPLEPREARELAQRMTSLKPAERPLAEEALHELRQLVKKNKTSIASSSSSAAAASTGDEKAAIAAAAAAAAAANNKKSDGGDEDDDGSFERNQRVKCKRCLENERNVFFLPCRHHLYCSECAERHFEKRSSGRSITVTTTNADDVKRECPSCGCAVEKVLICDASCPSLVTEPDMMAKLVEVPVNDNDDNAKKNTAGQASKSPPQPPAFAPPASSGTCAFCQFSLPPDPWMPIDFSEESVAAEIFCGSVSCACRREGLVFAATPGMPWPDGCNAIVVDKLEDAQAVDFVRNISAVSKVHMTNGNMGKVWQCDRVTGVRFTKPDSKFAEKLRATNQRLRELYIGEKLGEGWMEDGDVNALCAFWKSLESLALVSQTKIELYTLTNALSQLHSLTHLDLTDCEQVLDIALIRVGESCPRLRRLCLSGCSKVTSDGLRDVTVGCVGLVYVDLSNCSLISDLGVAALADRCRFLQYLNLYNCAEVTSVGIAAISGLLVTQRRDQSLSATNDGSNNTILLPAPARDRLPGGEYLTHLNLGNCDGINNKALACLATGCKRLAHLELYSCRNITDPGLKALATGCPDLVKLDIVGCSGVSQQGKSMFARSVAISGP